MAKRRTLAIGALGISLLVLGKSGILDSFFIFLLVGAIPGTSLSLPAGSMLALCSVATLLLILRFTAGSALEALSLHRLTRKHIAYRERMPKRRFHQLTQPQA